MTYYIVLMVFTLLALSLMRLLLAYLSSSNSVLSNALQQLESETKEILKSGAHLSDTQLGMLDTLNASATSGQDKLTFLKILRRVEAREASREPAAVGSSAEPGEAARISSEFEEQGLGDHYRNVVAAWGTVMIVRNPLAIFYLTYKTFRFLLRHGIVSIAQGAVRTPGSDGGLLKYLEKRRAC